MTKDEALRLAMDWYGSGNQDPDEFERLILSIVAQPEQDGECKHCTDGCPTCDARKLPNKDWIERERAVGYREGHRAALAQRTWVGLTDDEMQSIAFESADALSAVFVAEAKLKDKNT
jgi:hypothetical protein